MKEGKVADKRKSFSETKARVIVKCSECTAPQVIYSPQVICLSKGPRKEDP